jgi:dihydrodipicolinate synthase/N-acetylneuraminate lyase
MIRNAWRGVYSALTTKLDRAENLDLAAIRADVRFQIDSGVQGIVCCGSLGEASTLQPDEKIAIVKAAKEAVGGRAPVMLTVAEDSTRAAARLAEQAAAIGVDGLMVLPAMRYVSTPREIGRASCRERVSLEV